ncbi:unnamed protein product [Arctia plantaginis]|uniref:Alpha-carbonic anhydrase domain-containing protein n=1 Tax=Arctia plantaginis TaxID=874455 RepID=A0A8S1A4P0_ARCPL|nr:unnamed protein product [Arctia plantaginis]
MFNTKIGKITTWFLLFIQIQVLGLSDPGRQFIRSDKRTKTAFLVLRTTPWHFLRDQTSPRTNTLFDDADDIQRQLDNEARDRIKCGKPQIHWPDISEIPSFDLTLKTENTVQPFLWGRMLKLFPDEVGNRVVEVSPKTIWVFHFPTHVPTQIPLMKSDHYMKKSFKDEAQGVSVPPCCQTKSQDNSETDFKPFPSLSKYVKDIVLAHSYGWSRPKSLDGDIYSAASPFQTHRNWDYYTQNTWPQIFPSCSGRSQSPVDLPLTGLLKARGARPLFFQYFNVQPSAMLLQTDGQRAVLYGIWPRYRRPLIYGGAVHSRRYLFHSMTVHWPSEHRIGGQVYPVETQALFISAEYKTIQDALEGYPKDAQAILGISSLYKYGNHTHQGLAKMMNFSNGEPFNTNNFTAKPLTYFSPPFSSYVCYQGSLTVPPCTETVIWFVRARALSVRREFIDTMEAIVSSEPIPRRRFSRFPQPLNDRKVFIFK